MFLVYLGIFIISLTTLILELLMIRVFDVILYKNMAYIVITSALFSFGVAGVYSTLKPLKENVDINKRLSILSILFGISAFLIRPVMNTLPFDFEKFDQAPIIQLFSFLGMYIILALPFFFSGLIFTTIFSVFSKSIQKLYFWDLVGASLGCLIIIPFLPIIAPGGLLFIVTASCIIAAGLFSHNKRSIIAGVLAGLIIASIPFFKTGYFEFIEHADKRGVAEDRMEGKIEYSIWDPVSKIDIIDRGNTKFVAYDGGSQNSTIYQFDGDFDRLRSELPDSTTRNFWNRGVYSSHYIKRNTNQEVLVIGSAAGQEVKAALTFSAKHIDAVEMVGSVIELSKNRYSNYNGNIYNHKNVDVYVDEGRTFLSRIKKKYDIIQIFSNHTSSTIAAGSGALETSYLQTKESYLEYFQHLKPDGILHVNHPIYPRIITTAASAWKELNRKNFQQHVLIFEKVGQRDNLPTVLIKMNPWTSQEVEDLKKLFLEHPDRKVTIAMVENPLNPAESFLSADFYSGSFPEMLSEKIPYRVEPLTDNKPFFKFLREKIEVLNEDKETFVNRSIAIYLNSQLKKKFFPLDLIHIIVTGIVSLIAVFLFIYIPLKISSVGKKQKWNGRKESLIYFSCLGAGFIILELIFIQVFMKFIGNPLYNFSTVLFILLLSAGLGSTFSEKLNLNSGKRWVVPYIGIIVTGLILLFIHQPVFEMFLSASLPIRILITSILFFPLGFFLGMPFPLGILQISDQPKGAIAWAWGLNGAFTVVGGILSVVFALLLGFKETIFAALIIYAIAFFVYSRMRKLNKGNLIKTEEVMVK